MSGEASRVTLCVITRGEAQRYITYLVGAGVAALSAASAAGLVAALSSAAPEIPSLCCARKRVN